MTATSSRQGYHNWLCSQVALPREEARGRTFYELMEQMSETVFVATLSRDTNRIQDAKGLRQEFLDYEGRRQFSREWAQTPGSMLEIVIVLAKFLAFETEEEPYLWFWRMVGNLGLDWYDDRRYTIPARAKVADILDCVIWRTYDSTGSGGLFPLQHPAEDQRRVELWYQLNAYLLEVY